MSESGESVSRVNFSPSLQPKVPQSPSEHTLQWHFTSQKPVVCVCVCVCVHLLMVGSVIEAIQQVFYNNLGLLTISGSARDTHTHNYRAESKEGV